MDTVLVWAAGWLLAGFLFALGLTLAWFAGVVVCWAVDNVLAWVRR